MARTISSKAFVNALQQEKFASGILRNAYEANALSGIQDGKYVLKKMKENQIS